LRVLDERIFEPLGSNKSIPLRARLIVAANRSLEDAVKHGDFRADLMYRLNVIRLEIPPLRQRRSEIRPLVELLVEQLAIEQNVPVPQIDASAMSILQSFSWPGNIRELRNALEHAIALGSGGTIRSSDLPVHLTMARDMDDQPAWSSGEPPPPGEMLADARKQGEYRRLVDVLNICDNNRSQAAKALGISRTALYKRLVMFGIS
jgi:DNA-binding NtrC family response regulator